MNTTMLLSSLALLLSAFLLAGAAAFLLVAMNGLKAAVADLKGSIKKNAEKSQTPLVSLSDSVTKLVDIANSQGKAMFTCAVYTRGMRDAITMLGDAMSKINTQGNRGDFRDMDDVEKYRLGKVEEYLAQGLSENEASVRAAQDIMDAMSADAIDNIGVRL